MKIAIRTVVVMLFVAGAAASSLAPKASTQTTPVLLQNSLVVSSAIPIASCEPNDPSCI